MDAHPSTKASSWRIAAWAGAGALLLLPAIAMQVTDEVAWGPADFVLFGAMLAMGLGGYELATRTTGGRRYRAAAALALATAFLLVWMNLAVGLIGAEDHPANLMFGAVLAVGMAGAVRARSRPVPMARALVATALAQALAGTLALAAGWGGQPSAILGLTTLFVALWLGSAWLFRQAAQERMPAGTAAQAGPPP
ncbi:hypothetical protein [Geminicoccus harenae]|uniref:hypothetical protein n=1 Tax=Geminicoccus harenae TaxID=2498453 RepID=UPI001C97565C|nr:hypothetical protein [Geminicoccus harenae]